MNNDLDVSQLNVGYERKKQQKIEILNKVLGRCCSKIKYYSTMGKQWCVFHIPPYLIGYPLYKKEEAYAFLEVKLTEMGLAFKQIQPFVLLIGWKHIPSQFTRSQNEEVIVDAWGSFS